MMKTEIDCLLIGHNEIDFPRYEKQLRTQGKNSGAYRSLNLSFTQYNDKIYHISEIINSFLSKDRPLTLGDTFSPAIAYLGTFLHKRGFSFDYINSFQEACKK